MLSKYFCVIASQSSYMTAFPNSRHPPLKAMTAFIVSSVHFEEQVIYYIWKLLYSLASPTKWYLVPDYQEVTNLFSLTGWKQCLFTNVLCEIPTLHTSKIHKFGWKPSSMSLFLHKSRFWENLLTSGASAVNGCHQNGITGDCDVFISCLDSPSDGTHSLQRIHW